jgi:flagellar assembly protein FliH
MNLQSENERAHRPVLVPAAVGAEASAFIAGQQAAEAQLVAPLKFRAVDAYELSLYTANNTLRGTHEESAMKLERERRATDAKMLEEQTRSWEQMRKAVEEALARGRREAIAELEQQMRERLAQQVEEEAGETRAVLQQAVEQVEAERARYFHAAEREVVRLALAIAARVLHRESAMDALLLRGAVHAALEKLMDKSRLVLRVAPGDVERWRDHFSQRGRKFAIEVEAETALRPNDCVLETTMGTIELGVRTQLEEIERGFFDLQQQNPVRAAQHMQCDRYNSETSEKTHRESEGVMTDESEVA